MKAKCIVWLVMTEGVIVSTMVCEEDEGEVCCYNGYGGFHYQRGW